MQTIWFRIISVIALITRVMMFSGLASTIDAAQTVNIEASSDSQLKVKDLELRVLNGDEAIDTRRTDDR